MENIFKIFIMGDFGFIMGREVKKSSSWNSKMLSKSSLGSGRESYGTDSLGCWPLSDLDIFTFAEEANV